MALFHHIDLRVMWSDTDPAGIVWFGVFFRYFEHAEDDLYRRRLVCEASYRVACVDATTFAPQPFPREIGSLLRHALAGSTGPGLHTSSSGLHTSS